MKASAAYWLDPVGMTLSGLCLAHCLALPALSLALPFLGSWSEQEWVHLAVIVLAAPAAAAALRGPAARGLLAIAMLGLGCMIAAVLGWPGPGWELALNVSGGALLASAHALHWRRRHKPVPARCAGPS